MVQKIVYLETSKLLQDDRIKTIGIDNVSTTFNRIELLTELNEQDKNSVIFVTHNLFLADKEHHFIKIKDGVAASDTVGVIL